MIAFDRIVDRFAPDFAIEIRPYALLLLDQALIQLGTLAFGTSQNKIFRAADAVELYERLGSWVVQDILPA